MEKKEVELIICKVSLNGEDALHMKIYKEGTLCRVGIGGLPKLGISGMSFFNNSKYFDQLIELVPDKIFEKPWIYEEEHPNGLMEYFIAFFGVSENGERGEKAKWKKSTGIRLALDFKTQFSHEVFQFADSFVVNSAEKTNSWYFDIIMNSVYKLKSSELPNETIVTEPKTFEEIRETFVNYVDQTKHSIRKWDIVTFAENKIYKSKDGKNKKALLSWNGDTLSINFEEISLPDEGDKKKKRGFWNIFSGKNENKKEDSLNKKIDEKKFLRVKLEKNDYDGMRELIFKSSPEQLNIQVENEFTPFAVICDIGEEDVTATVVGLIDGNASFYMSSGLSIIGGFAQESIRNAAVKLALASAGFIGKMNKVEKHSTPIAGNAKIFVLTKHAIFIAEDQIQNLESNKSEFSPLYLKCHELISEIRLIEQSKR